MRAALLAAALLGVTGGCRHGSEAGPMAVPERNGAEQPSLRWQRSIALPAGESQREFALVAPDPAAHAFAVRVRHPAGAQLVVTVETSYGHLGVFDSNIHGLVPSEAVDCRRRRGQRACVVRFPRFVGERAGRWSVRVQKASTAPAAVTVRIAFSRVSAPGRPASASDAALRAKRRFAANGIVFSYPRPWSVTTERLSPSPNPAYRFAVSSAPIRRTPADDGPCLPGIARQLPPDGVLVYLREALGADRTRAVTRLPDRPERFPLPRPTGGGLCGFEQGGGRWYPFRDRRRAFYLGVHIGPTASRAARRAVGELLDGMEIRAR